ncbi:MAG: hypothetical protein ACI86H_001589, partial [bacterium]
FAVGAQYPLQMMRTRFEPDSGFTLKKGQIYSSFSISHSNSFEFSRNADKARDENGSSSTFNTLVTGVIGESDDKYYNSGYSIYIDAELLERKAHIRYGLTDHLEIQLTYRDILFSSGTLDGTIEQFHDNFALDNVERNNAKQDQFEIYVWDNETKEYVFKYTVPKSSYQSYAATVGFKYAFFKGDKSAMSLGVNANFNDSYMDLSLNELDSTSDHSSENRTHSNFDDYNISLNYSIKFNAMSFHAAYAVTYMQNAIFKDSPKKITYAFAGVNFHLSESFDFVLQGLIYSSIFPKSSDTEAGNDIQEITLGTRFYLSNWAVLEFGLVENNTQGPQNIDIAYFMSFSFVL